MHKFSIEEYRTYIEIIENEFGTKWLTKKIRQADKSGRWSRHPIPKYWKTAKDTLNDFENSGVLQVNRDLIALSAFGYHLDKVRPLPNYETTIRPRLKKEFTKVEFEIYVGALCVRSGYQTEFIPLSTKQKGRSADIKLLTDEKEFFIEATRKDDYNIQGINNEEIWVNLWHQVADLQAKLRAGHEVLVFPIGMKIGQEHIENILEELKYKILNDIEGIWVNVEHGYGLSIRKLPQPPRSENPAVFLPAGMNPGFAHITIAENEQGQKYATNYNRVAMYSIHSHKLSSVLNTFNVKRQRKQIPDENSGIIYINLDVSQVSNVDVQVYLDFVSTLLKTKLTKNTNTRIGAVVLVTSPLFIETNVDGNPFITLSRASKVIHNPFGSLPEDFIVP